MPVNYENQVCVYCGKAFAEDDDIVVCPECATPHHRECWKKEGRCANESLHAEGYVWKKEKAVYEETAVEEEQAGGDEIRVCHICGSENPAEVHSCGNCGAFFGERNGAEGGENDFSNAAYVMGTDISVDEDIGEVKAGDFAIYLRASAGRYVKKFKRFSLGKKFSFNFAAFFFSPYWFFYRKLYKAGIFLLVATVTLSIFSFSMTSILSENLNETVDAVKPFAALSDAWDEYGNLMVSGEYNVQSEEVIAASNKIYAELSNLMALPKENFEEYTSEMLLIVLITAAMLMLEFLPFVLNVVCALIADRLYYKKAVAEIKEINSNTQAGEESIRRLRLFKKGGLSPIAFGASYLGETMLINLLYYAAQEIQKF